MAGRRFLLYFAWNRPAECDIDLGNLENRYPTLFEFRRALWPMFDQLRSKPDQLVGGFLDHIVLSDFERFRQVIKEVTGEEVQLLQRVLDTNIESQLNQKMIEEFDTVIVVSLDHFRTEQAAADVEVEFLKEFLSREDKCVLICPHHDIGERGNLQEVEFQHHGDRLVPAQQRIGGFAKSLLAGLGYPVLNQYGLNPLADETGSPSKLIINHDLDSSSILQNVTTFNLHPHLPHLFVPAEISSCVNVLARQAINLNGQGQERHPFVEAGNRYFNALLQINASELAGALYICDATLWSSAFGGEESLIQFWNNLANL